MLFCMQYWRKYICVFPCNLYTVLYEQYTKILFNIIGLQEGKWVTERDVSMDALLCIL